MRASAVLTLTGAAAAALLFSFARPARAQELDPALDQPVTVDDLQQATEPYGEWLDTPEYGRVWRPDQEIVGDDFEPYLTNGRWVSTDDGWSFESAWTWGWATFHYGRWVYDARGRWLWCPDIVWGPAWVQWRTSGDTVAWVPLAPRSVVVDSRIYTPLWIAVEIRSFLRPDLSRYRIAPSSRVMTGRPSPPVPPPRTGPPVRLLRGVPPRATVAASRPTAAGAAARTAPVTRTKTPAAH